MIRFVLGTLASVGVIVFAILVEGGNLATYLILTPGFIALFLPFFASLAVWPLREWLGAWKDAFAAGESESAARSSSIWEFNEKASYASGIVGFIVGLIFILSSLGDLSRLGPAAAVSLTCPLYSVLLGLVCRILRARVERARH
jgi:flagellar motor component MotA